MDRLVLYPGKLGDLPREEEAMPQAEIASLQRNNAIAVRGKDDAVHLAQEEENHVPQQALSVYPMGSMGRGRLRDRQRKLRSEVRMVGHGEVVLRVDLEPAGVVGTDSVGDLIARGIAV